MRELSGEAEKSPATLQMIRHLLRCVEWWMVALCPARMLNTGKYLSQKSMPTWSHSAAAGSLAAAASSLAAAGVTAVSGQAVNARVAQACVQLPQLLARPKLLLAAVDMLLHKNLVFPPFMGNLDFKKKEILMRVV